LFSEKLENIFTFDAGIMTATLTYALLLAALVLGRKAITLIDERK